MTNLYISLMAASGLLCGFAVLRYFYIGAKHGAHYANCFYTSQLIPTILFTIAFCAIGHLAITIYSTHNRLNTIGVETSLQLQAVADGCLNKEGG